METRELRVGDVFQIRGNNPATVVALGYGVFCSERLLDSFSYHAHTSVGYTGKEERTVLAYGHGSKKIHEYFIDRINYIKL